MAKYFDKEKNKEIEVPEERWGWGVIYLPTLEACIVADRLTKERNAELKEKRNQAIKQANIQGVLALKRKEIYNWYNKEVSRPIEPFRDEFHQFDDRGRFHRISEIDQDRIYIASLYNLKDMSKRIDIPFRQGMKFIHKYVSVRPAGETEFKKAYLFGYKYKGQEHLSYVLPDDRVVMAPDQEVDLTRLGI